MKSAKENRVTDSCVALGSKPLLIPGVGAFRFAWRDPLFGGIRAFGFGTFATGYFPSTEPAVSAPFPWGFTPDGSFDPVFEIRAKIWSGEFEIPEPGEYF